MYSIYWLISENKSKTYVGFTSNIRKRLEKHKNKKVKTTVSFGKCKVFILEKPANRIEAIKREKYWKSCAGRKKLNTSFKKLAI